MEYMKGFITVCAVTAVSMICGTLFAEDLDALLQKQKEKTQRRTYSSHVRLDTTVNMEVPEAPTEEELAIDKKLRDMESQFNLKPTISPTALPPRPSVTIVPRENKNWLVPALTNSDENASIPEDDTSWVLTELERQKSMKEQLISDEDEKIMAENLLRQKRNEQELQRLKDYNKTPQQIFNSRETSKTTFSLPQITRPNPLSIIRPGDQDSAPKPLSPFSPQAIREAAAAKKDPLDAIRNPALRRSSPSSQLKRVSLTPQWNPPETKPLSPIEQIKRSSPIHRKDPFSDDYEPNVKTSIWQ